MKILKTILIIGGIIFGLFAIGFGLYGFIKKEFYSLGTIFAGISLVISFILFIIEKNNPK
ncbi:MAG TPA: hypothetical protein GX012_04605 [Acholeplasma sp.]|nr:hypothetical protein [Acholeplasma sp.]